MAISVYGWRKPTLELALVEGGTLLANTKYYVAGYMKFTPFVYSCVGGSLSDLYEITTTATARTISITQKTYRDITAFASGGVNITTLTCPLHCLATGDQMKIASGSYTGTWTVTKINKDTITIPTTYIDNTPVQCYTDSLKYNHPTPEWGAYSTLQGMTYYVSVNNPYTANNWDMNYWTSAAYQGNYNTNPAIITAPPTGNRIGQGSLRVRQLNNGVLQASDPYGTIYIRVDGGTYTLQQVYDAVVAEGFIYNCTYQYISRTFMLIGTMQFGTTGIMDLTGVNMTLVLGEIGLTTYLGAPNYNNFKLNNCLLNLIPYASQPYIYTGGNGTIYACNASTNGISGIQAGVGNYYWCSPLIDSSGRQTYTNLANGATISASTLNDLKVINTGTVLIMQSSYGAQIWKRNSMPANYYTLCNNAFDYEPNIYMMEDCYLFKTNGVDWHYRFYQYPAQDGKYNKVKYLNIDTDHVSNIKQCINVRQTNIEATWYRRLEFNFINTSNTPIQGVLVNVVDGIGNTYSGTSDVNGYCYVDVREQKTIHTQAMGVISTWNNTRDTYYSNFSISIGKVGYESLTSFIVEARNFKKQQLALKPIQRIRPAGNHLLIATSPESGSSSPMIKIR